MFTDKQFYVLLGIGAGALWYLSQQGEKINPASTENVVYQWTNDVTRRLTGRETDKFGRPLTLGAWLAGE